MQEKYNLSSCPFPLNYLSIILLLSHPLPPCMPLASERCWADSDGEGKSPVLSSSLLGDWASSSGAMSASCHAACVINLLLTMTLELSHATPEVVFLRVLRQPLGVYVEVPRLS